MTKQMDDVLEFLRSFIAGGANQDFKPWASELYQKLYRSADEPTAPQAAVTTISRVLGHSMDWGFTAHIEETGEYKFRVRWSGDPNEMPFFSWKGPLHREQQWTDPKVPSSEKSSAEGPEIHSGQFTCGCHWFGTAKPTKCPEHHSP